MTYCFRRNVNVSKIIAMLSYEAVTKPMITCHVPIIVTTDKPLTSI